MHHIEPQGYARRIGKPIEHVDTPHNLITICELAHHKHIHPDMLGAKAGYSENKNSYQEVFDERKEVEKRGELYWNPIYDDELRVIAKHQTRLAKMRGWIFPSRGGVGK